MIEDPHRREMLKGLISKEWPKLQRFFRTKVADADILDLVQSTFEAFLARKPDQAGAERAYLWGIARKQVLKYYERRRGSEPFDSSVHCAAEATRSPSSVIADRNRLLVALRSLPVDQQIAFELRHGEGLTLEETAEAVGVSLATVKRYLAQAEERLRAVLGAQADEVRAAYSEP
ncbi:MAG TPA: sigma-70 family RNA polymerase sigma factor [Burkholderiales bacterium]|nr:sigma-70 family RNA polymerase sigma factor [Burkholderiales bacterium]